MRSLAVTLRRLEHLKELVTERLPILYESTPRSHELSTQIAEGYGAVVDVYKRFAGDQKVVLKDGPHQKMYPNYFEAGWLSGRTFHTSEGVRELNRVIGSVRAAIEDEAPAASSADP